MRDHITQFTFVEHQSVILGDPQGINLTERQVDLLDRAQRSLGLNVFRWKTRKCIQFSEYVGVLAAGNISIEILPKTGLSQDDESAQRTILLRMIAAAWDVPVSDGDMSNMNIINHSIVELLIEVFARRLAESVRRGLCRRYMGQRGDLTRLRGKLDVGRQFGRHAAKPNILACRFDELTADVDLNRVLFCAVTLLVRMTRRSSTARLLSEVAMHFEDVEAIDVPTAAELSITFDRTNEKWRPLVRMAQSFLASQTQTTHTGYDEGITLLFDMNRLFEAYVAFLVRRELVHTGLIVRTQGPMNCLARHDNQPSFRTRPDIYIEQLSTTIVIDTKWKKLSFRESNKGVSQADAYQMYAYAHVYDADCVVLLYPHHEGFVDCPGAQHKWSLSRTRATLIVASIEIYSESAGRQTIRNIIDKAIEKSFTLPEVLSNSL